jgi:acetoin utilization protein AcuC
MERSMGTVFVYTDQYFNYEYGATHPLKIERLRLTYDLCKTYGLFGLPDAQLKETKPATESEILRFHTPSYVKVLKQASRGEFRGFFSYGLGPGDNPIFPGLWEWSLLNTGASLQCARLIGEGKVRIAFNIAGGLHHAMADRASGFCYVNDPALTILHFLDEGNRVMYLDIDAHHGDGVQWAFYEDSRVLTVSFHQDGRSLFPGTGSVRETGKGQGQGYAVNVPMLPGTDDTVFWDGFSAIIPPLVERYKPDVIVSQLGVDTFWNDPLASLELTTNGFCKVISYLTKHAKPWVALGGGGYNVCNVARAWTLAWAIMNGVELDEDLPESMTEPMSAAGYHQRKLRDPERKGQRQGQCAQSMAECVKYLEKNVFPRISCPN